MREYADGDLGIALDEAASTRDVDDLLACFGARAPKGAPAAALRAPHLRASGYLKHPTFSRYHAEHEFLRYVCRLQAKDLSLTTSMIPLGSCTMKLNATSEKLPVTWPEFGRIHPFAPADQTQGYRELFRQLEGMLNEITGFAATSLQPNAGSQGEYTGLLVIRAYHESRGERHRDVCLIPSTAHGTNPASAILAGPKVVPVKVDEHGAIDLGDLRARAKEHERNLLARHPHGRRPLHRGVHRTLRTSPPFRSGSAQARPAVGIGRCGRRLGAAAR